MKDHQTLEPKTKKFRLGIYGGGDLTQPISLMRFLGPFSAMAKEDPRLELVFPWAANGRYSLSWDWICQCDAIFYSHPQNDVDVSVLWLAQQMGVPVWSEYVDDIFNVLPTNPAYQNLKNKREVRECVTKAIEYSSFVTAVSDLCAKAYPYSERIAVIPEACLWPQNNFPRRKAVSWRGLGSHDTDTEGVHDAVCEVAKSFSDWEWTLLGSPSEDLVERLKSVAGVDAAGESNVKVAPYFSTPWHMVTAWGYRAPYLHIVPLANNAFNRCKSHLAYLEATAIGAAVIAPDYLTEWQQPGVISYTGGQMVFSGKQDFATVLRREMLSFKELDPQPAGDPAGGPRGEFHPNVRTARFTVFPDRTERQTNQLRWQVLRKLAALKSPHHLPPAAVLHN